MTYPWWEYPIISLWLLSYLVKCRFRIKAIIAWRKSIGIIPSDRFISRREWIALMLSFGHWGAGQWFIDKW